MLQRVPVTDVPAANHSPESTELVLDADSTAFMERIENFEISTPWLEARRSASELYPRIYWCRREGVEPSRDFSHQILSLACLPIPPSRHLFCRERPAASTARPSVVQDASAFTHGISTRSGGGYRDTAPLLCFLLLVPPARVELARPCGQRFLRPPRIPTPPRRHIFFPRGAVNGFWRPSPT